jgi:predicted DNA-binding transcriptional regulator YafY
MRSDRLLSLLLILQARGRAVAPEVARELEVSVRTVYRDVEALSAAGVPVWTEQGRGGGIRLMPGYRTDMTGLTAAEARALVAMSGRAVPDDLGMGSALASAVHKLVAAVPPSHRPAAEAARDRVLVDHAGWYRRTPSAPALEVVQDAVWARRRVRLDYRHGDGVQESVIVDPFGLVAKTGLWYLVGRTGSGEDHDERMWRVDRVATAVVLDEPATEPEGLDLAAVWDRLRRRIEGPEGLVPVEVVMRIKADVLDRVLRVSAVRRFLPPNDPGQDEEGMPSMLPDVDGWLRTTLRFRGEMGAVAALLAFGGDVEIISPPSTRRLMARTAEAALARHTGMGPG